MKHSLAAALFVGALAACGDETPVHRNQPVDPADQLETMKVAVAELMDRPEKDTNRVEVQYILISFEGAHDRIETDRVRPDAEQLAAELYCRLVSGEDIDSLVTEYSDDSAPGILVVNQQRAAPGEQARSMLGKGFCDASWRLEVGEIGVSPYHPKLSPHGWYVIRRLN